MFGIRVVRVRRRARGAAPTSGIRVVRVRQRAQNHSDIGHPCDSGGATRPNHTDSRRRSWHNEPMHQVTGVVKHYAWGDHDFIPGLLDAPTDGQPWAELWLGTHPAGTATTEDGHSLLDVTGELPYLLKVLAAAEPLSLQTHPNQSQAAEGFARENAAGLDLDSPMRLYRDPYAKPEMICALTPFDALCGFRPIEATRQQLQDLQLLSMVDRLESQGLAGLVAAIYRRDLDHARIIAACASHGFGQARLVAELAERYPDDPSVVVALLMNRVALSPGEAIFLPPGNLHAYLLGAGIEVLGASDNVIRGGMTPKHVDVDELMRIVDVASIPNPVVSAVEVRPGAWRYETPPAPFRLWRFEVAGTFEYVAAGRVLIICVDGATDVVERGHTIALADREQLEMRGIATLYAVEESGES
jgi:mannose-6-phosphate isomerase